MKVQVIKLCTTDSTDNNCIRYNPRERVLLCRLAFPNESEESLVFSTASKFLESISLQKLKDSIESGTQSLELNVSDFESLVAQVKQKGLAVEIMYPTGIIVGYVKSPCGRYTEGVYIHATGEITELPDSGRKAVYLLINELAKL